MVHCGYVNRFLDTNFNKFEMNKLSILAVATLALLVGTTSCSKTTDDSEVGEGKTGKLSISFSLPGEAPATRAIAASTSKPVTSWTGITRAMILFVDTSTDTVKDAREVILPTSGSSNTSNLYTGVIANAIGYDAYIVGNHPVAWAVGTMKGQTLASLQFAAPAATTYASGPHFDANSAGYSEVEDIFVAKQSNVVVKADENNTHPTAFALTRINSLFRVRIDVKSKAATTHNDKVSFTAPTAMISIRRAATSYLLTGSTTYSTLTPGTATSPGTYSFANSTKALNVFFKNEAMKDAVPSSTTHTNPSTMLSGNVTLWNEYKIFPGGSNATNVGSGLDKFDIVLSAVTTDATYIPVGHTEPVAAGTRVFWSGQVQKAVGPNQILELNIPLETKGTTTIPPVGEYGSLNITASIAQWGDIISSELPL